MDRKKILVVEDEKAIQNLLKIAFKDQYDVTVAGTAGEGIDACVKSLVDLIVLDLGLPDMDGSKVIEAVRGFSETLPILVLSARADESEKIRCLDAGANDYVQKPFSTQEFLARVRVCLRNRDSSEENSLFTSGKLAIDFAAHSVYLSGEEIHMTNFEYKILAILAQNAGKTLTHNYIISKVWGAGGNDAAGLRVFMAAIRRKIERESFTEELIRTDVGVGYRMNKL